MCKSRRIAVACLALVGILFTSHAWSEEKAMNDAAKQQDQRMRELERRHNENLTLNGT